MNRSWDAAAATAARVLADGKWHSWETTIGEMAQSIEPGVALRRRERDRRLAQERRQATGSARGQTYLMSMENKVRTGARSIARDILKLKSCFEVIVDGEGVKKVRMLSMPKAVKRYNQQEG